MAKIIVNFSLRIPRLKQEIPYPGSFSLFEATARPNPREQPGDLSEDHREFWMHAQRTASQNRKFLILCGCLHNDSEMASISALQFLRPRRVVFIFVPKMSCIQCFVILFFSARVFKAFLAGEGEPGTIRAMMLLRSQFHSATASSTQNPANDHLDGKSHIPLTVGL
jgi:hypothetical protein